MSSAIKMIVRTSNPLNSETGIDDTIHKVYMDCFEAIKADSDTRIAMYMWNNINSPAVAVNPQALTQRFVDQIKATNSTAEVLFDVDYMLPADVIAFKNKLLSNNNAGKAYISAFYPEFKIKNQNEKAKVKLHNKTMLFRRLKFAAAPKILNELAGQEIEFVIVESSANIWQSQYSHANQLILYYGDEKLYNNRVSSWADLKKQVLNAKPVANPDIVFYPDGDPKDTNPNKPIPFPVLDPDEMNHPDFKSFAKAQADDDVVSGNVKMYELPRSGNIVASILQNIQDADMGKSSALRIAMGDFSSSAVADELIKIAAKSNQSVKIVNRLPEEPVPALEKLAEPDSNIDIILPEKPAISGGYIRKVHSKYMLYEGDYDLGDGIKRHKLVFAGCLNYTGSGLNTNSETLARIADADLYDRLLKNWYELRYTACLPVIRAALQHKQTGDLHFFNADKFVKWIPGKGIETINTNNALRQTGVNFWQLVPSSFLTGTGPDAAFWYDDNNSVYFFKGNKYIKWTPTNVVPAVSPVRTIGVDGWELPSVFLNGIDAAFTHPSSGNVFFFKGTNYCEWKPGSGVVAPAVRKVGVDGWQLPILFLTGMDAAVPHAKNNCIYFFKGTNYTKWVIGKGVEAPAVRTIGKDGWEGLMF